jgi:hypothetical protein
MVIKEGYNVNRCYVDMTRERLVAFYKTVSAADKGYLSRCRLLPAETGVFEVRVELHYSTVTIEIKFMVFVVHEQLAIEDI